MVLIISVIFGFLSVFILGLLFIVPAVEKRQVSKSLEQIEAVHQPAAQQMQSSSKPEIAMNSFAERVTQPGLTWLSHIARKVTPFGMIDHYKQQLIYAGTPRDLNVDKFLAFKALCSLAILGILVLLVIKSMVPKSRLVVAAMILLPAAFFLPDLWLNRRIKKRQGLISRALPDTLDLLTISVEAGLGFDGALTKVIKNSQGPLAEEFSKMLSECQVGISRKEALKNLAERNDVPELRSFVAAMVQADVLGISISKVLHTQAHEMRLKRRQKAEEIAMKTPVKMVFPVVLCILPATLIVIVGPGAIRIFATLLPALSGS